jgi:glutaryl-CoA dehydrogenase
MQAISLDELVALEELLGDEERLVRDLTRRFVAEHYLPRAAELFENAEFPMDLIGVMGEMGLLGTNLSGYGCAGMNNVAYGLAMQELEYGDSGLRSFASVQGSLCMYPIHRFGSEEQKQKYLPKMAKGELVGCFGLTEPNAGSDPGAMSSRAVSDGDSYLLSGNKMWITNAPIADLAIVWAKLDGNDPKDIRGFIVDADLAGYSAPEQHHKMSLRASRTGEIVMNEVRVPKDALLPQTKGLSSPLSCLNQARFGIAFGAVGAARACYEEAVNYALQRKAFGANIASKQLVQAKLVDMSLSQLAVVHYARIKDQGKLLPTMVSLVKRKCVEMALETARNARAVLGANGITLDYASIRHAMNLESVITYEGTHEVHTLILGRGLTGEDAF